MTDLYPEIQPGFTNRRGRTITAGEVATFATLSGDMNPVHLDETYAKSTRYGRIIASGQHMMALMVGMVPTFLPSKSVGLGCSFRFVKPAYVGDTLAIEWVVTRREYKEKLKGVIIYMEGTGTNQRGETVITGETQTLLTPEL